MFGITGKHLPKNLQEKRPATSGLNRHTAKNLVDFFLMHSVKDSKIMLFSVQFFCVVCVCVFVCEPE